MLGRHNTFFLTNFNYGNGPPQYKLHNSKGVTYYITANESYVYVK
ncbi:N-acetylmuramoyl-L-alanine amidase (plasmid) [Bacillus thuringiensis]|uniref:N-acetylmuramoyl-L-alanine amidase n=2 Tax=Bacillus thuringiensis TaxID=1428 RepID=A0AAP4V660_BACTU|nr:N-acetylmuramoyl-L-alanine amidase [Bacillus thuringiensis serovar thuringiensis str. IS5056]ARP61717.1 N-acetylmuramoyl-L-alanine amidase [Bacillus thuringiensis]OTW38700.1 N-acetylmuramoyl-L-alanine amidase [Bacillus thuringiensis serovar thuringiensis]AST05367.1 N-acetylmuramoyl-L-alanine amidase [Bacillus thuringiensis]MBN6708500.1 N-acetylmuramoyl-L-alanine amidase [Bacillus thuringiensis]